MHKLKFKKLKGFTLVELIIVITILAILATIAFVSFQGYVKDSRDSTRLTTLKNIESGLQTFQVTTGNYPEPDSKINILASGTLIGYQGNIGDTLTKIIKINKKPEDPLDKNLYTYGTNIDKTKYQLLTFNENQTAYIGNTYAGDNSLRNPKSLGNNLGILLDMNKIPLEQYGTGVDIILTTNTYYAYIGDKKVFGTGNVLRVLTAGYARIGGMSFVKSCKEIKDNGLSSGDGIYSINPNLSSTGTYQVYCDMNTESGGWTLLASIPGESAKFADIGLGGIWKNPVYDSIPPQTISNIEYLSKAYGNLPTNEILLCYKNTSMCYNFKHNMNIPLYNFYRDNLSYVDYSFNLFGYGNQGNITNFQKYFTTFGLPGNSNGGNCGFLGINARIASISETNLLIGYAGDGNGPCINELNLQQGMDDYFLGIGFRLRFFGNLSYPGQPNITASPLSYNIIDALLQPINTLYGWTNTYVSRNWFIMGR